MSVTPTGDSFNVEFGETNNMTGKDGVIFTPHISEDGFLFWTNDGGLPNPEPVKIKGPEGKSIVKSEINENGELVLTYSDASVETVGNVIGPQGPEGKQGKQGPQGDPYVLTDADRSAIENNIRPDFANALKGTAIGSTVRLDDISPFEHEIAVKLSSDTVTDFSGVTLTKYGKNLFRRTAIAGDSRGELAVNGNRLIFTSIKGGGSITFTLGKYKEFVGKDITISLDFIECKGANRAFTTRLFADSTLFQNFSTAVGERSRKTYQIPSNDTAEYLKVDLYVGYITAAAGDYVVIDNMQVEIGNNATEWEEGKEPTAHTANADGTVNGVTSVYPTTTLLTDTDGVNIEAEYNKDTNKSLKGEPGNGIKSIALTSSDGLVDTYTITFTDGTTTTFAVTNGSSEELRAEITEALAGKLDASSERNAVYATGMDGKLKMLKLSSSGAIASQCIPITESDGRLKVKVTDPIASQHPTTKKYVDDLVAELEEVLKTLTSRIEVLKKYVIHHTITWNNEYGANTAFVDGKEINLNLGEEHTFTTSESVVFDYSDYDVNLDVLNAFLKHGIYIILLGSYGGELATYLTVDGNSISADDVSVVALGGVEWEVYTISGTPANEVDTGFVPLYNADEDETYWISRDTLDDWEHITVSCDCGCGCPEFYVTGDFNGGELCCPYCGDIFSIDTTMLPYFTSDDGDLIWVTQEQKEDEYCDYWYTCPRCGKPIGVADESWRFTAYCPYDDCGDVIEFVGGEIKIP